MSENPAMTRVLFPDIHGMSHGKYVAAGHLEHPTHYAITVLAQGIDLTIMEAPGYGADLGFPDMEARADLRTRRSGWEPGVDVVIADLWRTDRDERVGLDPRWALQRQIDRWTARGLTPLAGFEMECYLLAEPYTGQGRVRIIDVPAHRVYAAGPGCDPTGLGLEIFRACQAAGIETDGYNGEFHPGQIELATHYRDALGAADDAFLFKELAREVALARGMGVTFMARPRADLVGSGLHVNISMARSDGSNEFDAPGEPNGLSITARHAIAGLIAHHEGLAAVCGPTVNSYKRLIPGILAGYWANWGLDNRISTVRVPGPRGRATRIEHRLPDGAANPHLVLAALLAAMTDGVERALELPAPQEGDGDAAPNTDRHTPSSLAAALDAFEADPVLVDGVGSDLAACFLAIKRDEWAKYVTAVTDWEHTTYGARF
jgi:glutamine synthetase